MDVKKGVLSKQKSSVKELSNSTPQLPKHKSFHCLVMLRQITPSPRERARFLSMKPGSSGPGKKTNTLELLWGMLQKKVGLAISTTWRSKDTYAVCIDRSYGSMVFKSIVAIDLLTKYPETQSNLFFSPQKPHDLT